MARRSRFVLSAIALSTVLCVASALADAGPGAFSTTPIHSGGRMRSTHGVFSVAGGAYPDAEPRYHNGNDLVCGDCHIMHASQTHPYDPAGARPGEEVPYAGGPNPKLLKTPDPLDLCLNCHDGRTFAPDVLGADVNGLVQRSAGHFDEPELVNPRGHDLGRGLPDAEGFGLCTRCHFSAGEDAKVTCIDCHNPHGNGVARNLQWASDPASTPDLGLFVNPGASGLARYEASNVSYGTLNTDQLREVTNMCLDCHHIFSGGTYIDPDGDGFHNRHPTYDSERGSINAISQGDGDGRTNSPHWLGGTGSGFMGTPRLRFVASGATDFASGTVVDADNDGVFCLSCHTAHGSDQAFAMTWTLQDGYGAPGCDQCHYVAQVDAP